MVMPAPMGLLCLRRCRKVGHPRLRWEDGIAAYVCNVFGATGAEWVDIAQDATTWELLEADFVTGA